MPGFPVGATITLEELEDDPHPALARLREAEPVSWVPVLGGWLVTAHALAVEVMRDAERFTVDDPRFSTAQVVGPSMLSLDGAEHDRHRSAFASAFRGPEVHRRFEALVSDEVGLLRGELEPQRHAELRRKFAGPLAAGVLVRALGLERDAVPEVLALYDAIVGGVNEITAGHSDGAAGGAAFERLRAMVGGGSALASEATDLNEAELASNVAVLLFGGIETTEAMIANALLWRLRDGLPPEDDALEESLRLEPAAAVVDRYATGATELGGVAIAAGDLVRVSLAGANRDPAVFPEPDRFDPSRRRAHLAFAQGPHVCLGVHLARLEARQALAALATLPGLELDPDRPPPRIRGLVFRKPPELWARWG